MAWILSTHVDACMRGVLAAAHVAMLLMLLIDQFESLS